jgi:hypothetical protein
MCGQTFDADATIDNTVRVRSLRLGRRHAGQELASRAAVAGERRELHHDLAQVLQHHSEVAPSVGVAHTRCSAASLLRHWHDSEHALGMTENLAVHAKGVYANGSPSMLHETIGQIALPAAGVHVEENAVGLPMSS